jgi:phytanoyl-CoA hydroxylase
VVTVPTPVGSPKTLELAIPHGEAEPPLYRSRYGGLWVDRSDAHELLAARLARGEVTEVEGEALAHYIDHGYVVFPKAVDESVVDAYVALFEAAWDNAPERLWLQCDYQGQPMDRKFYDEVAKVGSLHLWFDRAGELIFPSLVLRFLTQIYERPPVIFQTLTMRKGSEETLHIDTAPLTLTEPMSLVGSWLALEDVQPLSGEFQFVPGSHRLPESLHHGTDKGHHGDHDESYKVLTTTLRLCEERGLKTEHFLAQKGDVLIWHGDLMHGGAPIQNPESTRKSLIAHLMPLGVMPTMFDFSGVSAVPYDGGGYTLDIHWSDMIAPATPAARTDKKDPAALWQEWIPLGLRKRVPPALATWARQHMPR